MLRAARGARAEDAAHVEFTLHSSELMPGGSPKFRNARDIERLYGHLEILFEELSTWCRGMTLSEFHSRFGESLGKAPSGNPGDRLSDRAANQEMAGA
jgi:hypothetical protein